MSEYRETYYCAHKFCYRLSLDDLGSSKRFIGQLIQIHQINSTNIRGLHCSHCESILNMRPLNCAISHNTYDIVKYIFEKDVSIVNFDTLSFPGSIACKNLL